MRRGEGLAGWVAEHRRPAFIPDNALADPRIKYFPELEEEKYQSIVSVPADRQGRRGDGRDRAARRGAARVQRGRRRLPHPLGLAGGERDRERPPLRGRAPARARAGAALARCRSRSPRPGRWTSCCRTSRTQSLALLRADSVHVYLAEPNDRLRRRASAPDRGRRAVDPRPRRAVERAAPRRPRRRDAAARWRRALSGGPAHPATITVPLVGGRRADRLPRGARRRAAARSTTTIATSPPRSPRRRRSGIKKIRLIEGLEERNLIKDFFADLTAGRRREGLGGRARRLGCDLDQPKLALVVVPWRGEPRSAAEAAHVVDRFENALRPRAARRAVRPPGRDRARPRARARRRRERVAAPAAEGAGRERRAAATCRRRVQPVRRHRGDRDGVRGGAAGRPRRAGHHQSAGDRALRRTRPVQVPAARAGRRSRARSAPRGPAPPARVRPRAARRS